ncbi:hypothetical protein V8C86DRAFT_1835285 [Haematococcus lacustris]
MSQSSLPPVTRASRRLEQKKPGAAATNGAVDAPKVCAADIQLVQSHIERCIQLYMTQKARQEVVQTLQQQAKVEPNFTKLVWQKLEEQNPDFFEAYHLRLRVKEQVVMFNFLVDQQIQMMQKLHQSWMQAMPAVMASQTPGMLSQLPAPLGRVPSFFPGLSTIPPTLPQPQTQPQPQPPAPSGIDTQATSPSQPPNPAPDSVQQQALASTNHAGSREQVPGRSLLLAPLDTAMLLALDPARPLLADGHSGSDPYMVQGEEPVSSADERTNPGPSAGSTPGLAAGSPWDCLPPEFMDSAPGAMQAGEEGGGGLVQGPGMTKAFSFSNLEGDLAGWPELHTSGPGAGLATALHGSSHVHSCGGMSEELGLDELDLGDGGATQGSSLQRSDSGAQAGAWQGRGAGLGPA